MDFKTDDHNQNCLRNCQREKAFYLQIQIRLVNSSIHHPNTIKLNSEEGDDKSIEVIGRGV